MDNFEKKYSWDFRFKDELKHHVIDIWNGVREILRIVKTLEKETPKWKPSGSAPRDGSRCLFSRTDAWGENDLCIGFWHDGQNTPGFVDTGSGQKILIEVWNLWQELPKMPYNKS